ncbi:hypothetical protein MRX96_041710 [Rhipicephalus microplus]
MDRPKRPNRPSRGTHKIAKRFSTTSLSQDTDQIVSSWHRFVRRRDLAENHAAATHRNRWHLQRTGVTAASQRDAALQYLSAFPYPRERSSQDGTPSSPCNADDS